MKKLVSVIEVEGEGLQALQGEIVTLFCVNYFHNYFAIAMSVAVAWGVLLLVFVWRVSR